MYISRSHNVVVLVQPRHAGFGLILLVLLEGQQRAEGECFVMH